MRLEVSHRRCDRVDVYGAGLFSRGPDFPKVYVHSYDPYVAACRGRKPLRFTPHSYSLAWFKQRLADEMTLHVLHAFGVVRWQTAEGWQPLTPAQFWQAVG